VDTAKFTDVIVARFANCTDLVREGKVFFKNKIKVASGMGCSERAVVYFRELLLKSNKKKFSFRRVESEKIGSQPGSDLLYTVSQKNWTLFHLSITFANTYPQFSLTVG